MSYHQDFNIVLYLLTRKFSTIPYIGGPGLIIHDCVDAHFIPVRGPHYATIMMPNCDGLCVIQDCTLTLTTQNQLISIDHINASGFQGVFYLKGCPLKLVVMIILIRQFMDSRVKDTCYALSKNSTNQQLLYIQAYSSANKPSQKLAI